MSGLILLAALAALIALLVWLSGLITRRLPLSNNWKTWLRVAIVVGAFPLMLMDEIIGKYQFEALCKANGIESADVSRARGKRVKVKYGEREFVYGTIMPIKESNVFFIDADTDEVVIQHKNYYAMGGWIMRSTPIGMGHSQPMLFGGSTCDIRVERAIFKANSILFLYK